MYRHYLTFQDYVATSGQATIDHDGITISFYDLERALTKTRLSPRKEEAFYLNVIQDMKQKDVAAIMGITTVSVGQYVELAVLQIAENYFEETEGK